MRSPYKIHVNCIGDIKHVLANIINHGGNSDGNGTWGEVASTRALSAWQNELHKMAASWTYECGFKTIYRSQSRRRCRGMTSCQIRLHVATHTRTWIMRRVESWVYIDEFLEKLSLLMLETLREFWKALKNQVLGFIQFKHMKPFKITQILFISEKFDKIDIYSGRTMHIQT